MKNISNKKPVFLVLVDALRYDYVEHMPFLKRLSQDKNALYVRKIRPSFGFCEISEYLTGTPPNINYNFCQYTFKDNNNFFTKFFFNLIDLFSRPLMWHPFTKKAFYKVFNKFMRHFFKYTACAIPIKKLFKIKTPEAEKNHFEEKGFRVESFVDILRELGKTVNYKNFVIHNTSIGDDKSRILNFIKDSKDKYSDFSILYIGHADWVGHKYGPDSKEIKELLVDIDKDLNKIFDEIKAEYEEFSLIFLGDHGMVPVTKYVNILEELEEQGIFKKLKEGKDFEIFIDSTLFRVWTYNEQSQKIFEDFMEKMKKHGKILKSQNLEFGNYYGDLILSLDAGQVFYPDYFELFKPKGMHGYNPDIDEQKGLMILYDPKMKNKRIEEAELIDICPLTCNLLDIRVPKDSNGKKLIK